MVPVAERAPYFRQPLCRRLLQALLRQACYPADFVTWDERTDDDEDDFGRFRCAMATRMWRTPYQKVRCLCTMLSCCDKGHVAKLPIISCRSNAVKEALGLLYALLRADYLQECSRLAASTNSWQYKEVALYAMR